MDVRVKEPWLPQGVLPACLRAWRAAARVVDFLLPSQCVICRKLTQDHDGLCASCWADLSFIERPFCERLGVPFAFDPGGPLVSLAAEQDPPPYGRARAACHFDLAARELVHAVKYRDRHEVVALMARLMVRAGSDVLADADILVPVPLHYGRLWRRRYNQAALLGHAVAALAGKPSCPGLLLRTKRTRQQVGLSADQRRRNVAGAFAVAHDGLAQVDGRQVLLIDDVLTTGATVEGCARALLRAGARGVDVLTFARVVDPIASPI